VNTVPHKILVVLDEQGTMSSLDPILTNAGFEVIVVHSFAEAIRVLQLSPAALPEELGTQPANSSFVIPPLMAMEEIEREAILQTLERTSGNIRKSAQILRYPRPTFYRKLKKLGIKVNRRALQSA
jgi:DNA-binding NtrC family response regulator